MLAQPLIYFSDITQQAVNVLEEANDFDLHATHEVMYRLVIGIMLTENGVPAHILERLKNIASLVTRFDPVGDEDAVMVSLKQLSSEELLLLTKEIRALNTHIAFLID